MTLSLSLVPPNARPQLQLDGGVKFESVSSQLDRISEGEDSTIVRSSKKENSWREVATHAIFNDGGKTGEIDQCISKELSRIIAPTNTRNIGALIVVQLRKEAIGGLGFSITARDNHAGPDSPIYIKNISPSGAAFKNGKLQPGDRLVQIDEILLSGASLNKVTSILRNTKVGVSVQMVVSRQINLQENKDDSLVNLSSKEIQGYTSSNLPPASVCLPDEVSQEVSAKSPMTVVHPSSVCCSDSQIQTLTVKLIRDGSEDSQLGVRVKRTRKIGSAGLQVRAIMSGSLAEKDGQLLVNDCLTEVNGISVLNLNKSFIMELFRTALKNCLENDSVITITLIRKRLLEIPSSLPLSSQISTIDVEQFPSACLQTSNSLKDDKTFDLLHSPCKIDLVSGRQDCFEADGVLENHSRAIFSEGHSNDLVDCQDSFRQSGLIWSLELKRENGIEDPHKKKSQDDHNGQQCDNSTTRGSPDGQPEEAQCLELSCVVDGDFPQEEDAIFDSDELSFRRDGFGRRSVSEKRSYQDFLSRSEIYQNIKENRKKKELILHEDKLNLHENPVIESSMSTQKEPVDLISPTEKLELKQIRDNLSDDDQTKLSNSPSTTLCNYTNCDHMGDAPASATSKEQDSVTASPSVSESRKSAKKFDTATIRGFFKKGFSELFRSEKKTEISQSSHSKRITQSLPENYHLTRGSSLPRMTSYQNVKDGSAFLRFPPHPPYQPYSTSTLPTAASTMYFARFRPMSPARNAFPIHHIHLNPDPVAPRFPGQNRFPVPTSNPVNFPYNRPLCYPNDSVSVQPLNVVPHRNPAFHMFRLRPCRPSWSLPQCRQNFPQLPYSDRGLRPVQQYVGNAHDRNM